MSAIVTAVLFACVGFASAQQYVSQQYTTGSNTDLMYTIAPAFNGRMDTLKMNVFYPLNDLAESRPLIIWIHGGGFTAGNRAEMNALCTRWASRGYVAVTISYRLGFFGPWPFDPPFAYDASEVIRACYRGVQDLRSAASFLVANASTYRIDTSRTVIGGSSAGAIIAMHGAFVDASDTRPPALGLLAEVTRALERFARPDLGSLNGWAPSTVPQPSVKAVINIFGGLFELASLNGAPFVPTFSYHQRADPVVPCATAKPYWGLPIEVNTNYPLIHGSCKLTDEFVAKGIPPSKYHSWLHAGTEHAVHNEREVDSVAAVFVAAQFHSTVSVSDTKNYNPFSLNGPFTVLNLRGMVEFQSIGPLDRLNLPDGVYIVVSSNRQMLVMVRSGEILQ